MATVLAVLTLGARPVEPLAWSFVQSRPLLSTKVLESRLGIRSYFDRKRQRLLLEGQGKMAFFTPWGSFAVIDGRFQRLARPLLVRQKGKFVDAALIQSHLLPFISEGKRVWLKEEIRRAFSKVRNPVCALERPVRRVFIDPGHGGAEDGGVRNKMKEKDLVLSFATLTAMELKKMGFEVHLSRNKDEAVPLDLRPTLANEWKADVFVSLHANTSPAKYVRGVETYILSSDATDDEARKLAVKENSTLATINRKSSRQLTLDNILWDIGQTAFLQDSAVLAASIQNQVFASARKTFPLKGKKGWRNRGVREAPFIVLSRSAMPAVLVELAYLSNSKDRALLGTKKFQRTLAKAIADGVKKYSEHCSST